MDDEIKGEGNSVNYKYRMHDPRVGRFFAVDPLAASYPHNSPYAFSENRVLDGVELEGLEYIYYEVMWWDAKTGKCAIEKTGEVDYKNWLLNATDGFGGTWSMPTHVIKSPKDGRNYFFEPSEYRNAKISDFDPSTRYTEDGILALYTVTDALGGAAAGRMAKKLNTPKFNGRPNSNRAPSARHKGANVKMKSVAKNKNTVYDKSVDIDSDVKQINQGNYIQDGNNMVLENGRSYINNGGELVPVSGPGIIPVSRTAYKGLGVLNEKGMTLDAFKTMKQMKLDNASIREAYNVYYKVN